MHAITDRDPGDETAVTQPDVVVENHSSIFLFRPLTNRAAEWLSTNAEEDSMHFGQALVVEHRFARDLAAGLIADGLVVK